MKSKSSIKERKSVCATRKACGLSCAGCMYSGSCEEYNNRKKGN